MADARQSSEKERKKRKNSEFFPLFLFEWQHWGFFHFNNSIYFLFVASCVHFDWAAILFALSSLNRDIFFKFYSVFFFLQQFLRRFYF